MPRLIDHLKRKGLIVDPNSRIQCIVADYWQEYIDNLPYDPKWTKEHFPCVAPPFEMMLIEARNPVLKDSMVGMIVEAYTLDQIQFINPHTDEFIVSGAKWVFRMYGIMMYKDAIMFPPCVAYISVAPHGEILSDLDSVYIEVDPKLHNNPRMESSAVESLVNILPVALHALSAINAVNVVLVDRLPPPRLSKSAKKKYGVPISPYKEIVVRSREINLSRMTGKQSANRRLHRVRGHFKNRGGRRYYWSPHFRGSKDVGEIDKTYIVEE